MEIFTTRRSRDAKYLLLWKKNMSTLVGKKKKKCFVIYKSTLKYVILSNRSTVYIITLMLRNYIGTCTVILISRYNWLNSNSILLFEFQKNTLSTIYFQPKPNGFKINCKKSCLYNETSENAVLGGFACK